MKVATEEIEFPLSSRLLECFASLELRCYLSHMAKLFLLFIIVPAIELVLLIKLGGLIGVLPTLGIIVLTGALGATLARWQGLGVLRDAQNELARGGMPTGPLVDGVIILIAAALLLTPGFLTDLIGFSCLVPGFRSMLKRTAWKRLEKAVQKGQAGVFVQFGGRGPWNVSPPSDSDSSGNIEM